jgi:hypothetical protein
MGVCDLGLAFLAVPAWVADSALRLVSRQASPLGPTVAPQLSQDSNSAEEQAHFSFSADSPQKTLEKRAQ